MWALNASTSRLSFRPPSGQWIQQRPLRTPSTCGHAYRCYNRPSGLLYDLGGATCWAVFPHKDDDRVVSDPELVQFPTDLADILVDAFDHAEELRTLLGTPIVIYGSLYLSATLRGVCGDAFGVIGQSPRQKCYN